MYTVEMRKKRAARQARVLSQPFMIRMDEGDLVELKKEAEEDGRDFSSYVRHLLKTHPGRPGFKKK